MFYIHPHMRTFLSVFLICFSLMAQAHPDTSWNGLASYYHPRFEGRKTSNGSCFHNNCLTAANNFLPLGSRVKVTNQKNHHSVIVVINDRMHHRNKRLLDVSAEAARQLGFLNKGLCHIHMQLLPSSSMHNKKHKPHTGKRKKSPVKV